MRGEWSLLAWGVTGGRRRRASGWSGETQVERRTRACSGIRVAPCGDRESSVRMEVRRLRIRLVDIVPGHSVFPHCRSQECSPDAAPCCVASTPSRVVVSAGYASAPTDRRMLPAGTGDTSRGWLGSVLGPGAYLLAGDRSDRAPPTELHKPAATACHGDRCTPPPRPERDDGSSRIRPDARPQRSP